MGNCQMSLISQKSQELLDLEQQMKIRGFARQCVLVVKEIEERNLFVNLSKFFITDLTLGVLQSDEIIVKQEAPLWFHLPVARHVRGSLNNDKFELLEGPILVGYPFDLNGLNLPHVNGDDDWKPEVKLNIIVGDQNVANWFFVNEQTLKFFNFLRSLGKKINYHQSDHPKK